MLGPGRTEMKAMGVQIFEEQELKGPPDWPETNPENAPDRQPKLPLLGATQSELISVLFHMYFVFSHVLCF